jgi:predicted transport protein
MEYKISFSCSEDEFKSLNECAINHFGIEFNVIGKEKKIRNIDSDNESDIISEYIEFAEDRERAEIFQPKDLIRIIEIKSEQKLDPKKFGSAMKNLGFAKQCVRIDGKPKHVYLFKWK